MENERPKRKKNKNPFTHFKSGLCMSESISSLSPSVSESKFFLLYIGKCHLQKNHEKKIIITVHFLEK